VPTTAKRRALQRSRLRARGVNGTFIAIVAIAWFSLNIWFLAAKVMLGVAAVCAVALLAWQLWIRRSDRALEAALYAGALDDALRMIEQAGKLSRRSLAFQHLTALVLWRSGEPNAALALMAETSAAGRYRPAARIDHLGMLLEQRDAPGAVVQAEALLRKLSRFKTDPEVIVYAARLHIIRMRYDAADMALTNGLSRWPGDADTVLANGLSRWPNDPDLIAQLAALRLAQGRAEESAVLVERVLKQDPAHPHARVLRARSSGHPDDHAAAREAIDAAPRAFVEAELSEQSAFRLPEDDNHTTAPASLQVQRDLHGLHYTVSTWERLAPLTTALKACAGVFFVAMVLFILSGAADIKSEALVMMWVWVLGISGTGLVFGSAAFGLIAALGGERFRARVTVDASGMRVQRPGGTDRILWATCDDVQRRGRQVEVLREGDWIALPSPNAVTDAQWLEAQVRQQIDAQAGAPRALPEDAAAALKALTQRT